MKKISLRDSVLKNIHTLKLQPKPKWQYILGHILLWVVCFMTLVAGAVAFSLMLMAFNLPERVFIHWMDMQENTGMLMALPYLWLLGVALALSIGYFLFSRTGRGYRVHILVTIGALITGSLILGTLLYGTHAIHWGEERMLMMEPHYREFRQGMKRMMPRPEDGVLPMRVTQIQEDIIT